jgi:hypothetical protein
VWTGAGEDATIAAWSVSSALAMPCCAVLGKHGEPCMTRVLPNQPTGALNQAPVLFRGVAATVPASSELVGTAAVVSLMPSRNLPLFLPMDGFGCGFAQLHGVLLL